MATLASVSTVDHTVRLLPGEGIGTEAAIIPCVAIIWSGEWHGWCNKTKYGIPPITTRSSKMGNDTTNTTTVVVLEDLTPKERSKMTPGTKFFVRRTGSYGTVLAQTSVKGKKLAELTCTAGGPNHIREQSDWHQCGVSQEMKKTVKKAKKTETVDASPADVVAAAEVVRANALETLNAAREGANLPPVAVSTVA
jgi:hypothetical protein